MRRTDGWASGLAGWLVALGAGILVTSSLFVACSSGSPASASTPKSPKFRASCGQPAAATVVAHPTGTLSLAPSCGAAGTVVHVEGTGLPAGQAVQLEWQQVTGSWQDPTDGDLLGSQYSESYVPLVSADTDASGSLSTSFTVPTGFGFSHTVLLSHSGQAINDATFNVSMTASISPKRGPVGTPIHVTVNGIGWSGYYDAWDLTYDNMVTGWLDAVSTDGTANAVIPATGAPGVHSIGVQAGADREPYLNAQQAPITIPPIYLTFTVTAGEPVLPASTIAQSPTVVAASADIAPAGSPSISLNDASGPPGTPLVLQGRGFPSGQPVQVTWQTDSGSHITSVSVVTKTIATSETDSTGAFEVKFPAPSDLGDAHLITATSGSATATTSFTITTKDLGIRPDSGPAGTKFTIHVVGAGFNWTSNAYGVDYDNTQAGFACGVNTGGDITMNMVATGAPGWHFIYLYPIIWDATDMEFHTADYMQIAELNVPDHPGQYVPPFEFAFDITKAK